MSRDGVDREYAKYNIPESTEELWLKELTAKRIAELGESGNWSVIFFLIHHDDFTHLPELLTASPQGKLWEKCAFLEELLKYLAKCRERSLFSERIDDGYAGVVSLAAALLRLARSDKSKSRIQAIINSANSARGG